MTSSRGGKEAGEGGTEAGEAAKAVDVARNRAQEAEMHRIPKPPERNRRGRARKVGVMG